MEPQTLVAIKGAQGKGMKRKDVSIWGVRAETWRSRTEPRKSHRVGEADLQEKETCVVQS